MTDLLTETFFSGKSGKCGKFWVSLYVSGMSFKFWLHLISLAKSGKFGRFLVSLICFE